MRVSHSKKAPRAPRLRVRGLLLHPVPKQHISAPKHPEDPAEHFEDSASLASDNQDYDPKELKAGPYASFYDSLEGDMAAIAHSQMWDWALAVSAMMCAAVLETVDPYHQVILSQDLYQYKYPLLPDTVPPAAVPVIAYLIPALIFLLFFVTRRDKQDLMNAFLGLTLSVFLTAAITNATKVAVGRPRPHAYHVCFPDGKEAFDAEGRLECSAHANEAFKSFPSGHASWSASGLGFLSLYLAGKLRVFCSGAASSSSPSPSGEHLMLPASHPGDGASTSGGGGTGSECGAACGGASVFVASALPLLVAYAIAITRFRDYWHHWDDITVGFLLGLAIAYTIYKLYFPALSHPCCHLPLSAAKVRIPMEPVHYDDEEGLREKGVCVEV
eukprot:jgi/Mesvir1/29437/Mv23019-RA.1